MGHAQEWTGWSDTPALKNVEQLCMVILPLGSPILNDGMFLCKKINHSDEVKLTLLHQAGKHYLLQGN